MKFGRGLKAVAIVLAAVIAVAIALGYILSTRLQRVLREELDSRLPAVALGYGLSVEFEDIALNPITGPALEGVSISAITSGGTNPLVEVKSIKLLYSLDIMPELSVRIDGLRLIRPRVFLAVDAEGSTNFEDVLANLMKEDGRGEVGASGLPDSVGGSELPVKVSDVLRLDWKRGRLDISDARIGREDQTNRIGLHGISGRFEYDRGNSDILSVTGARIEGNNGKVDLKVERKSGDFYAALRAENVGLEGLAHYIPSFAVPREDAAANFKLIAESVDGGSLWGAEFVLDVDDISFDHWRLSDRVIGDIDLTFSGKLRLFATDRRVEFEQLRIGTDGLAMNMSGYAEFADGFRFDAMMESGRMPIQKALDAMPKGFVPVLRGAKVGGVMNVNLAFGIDTNNLSALKFEPSIEVDGFELIEAPNNVDIEKLKKPFMHKARKKGEVVKEFLVGHPNYWFVPFKRLGKHTIKGVLTCEDGSFFRHGGFQVKHFRESLIQDIRERRFARGASTITMQTAKNLFLTGKKNLSRKFQEILIAYAMEQMLAKERILEIYMNIIEWGPKIYGVGAASKHYFDKWPKDLNPVEAAFLGSIIPTASRSHYMYTRGSVPDQWSTYLALIVSKMGVTGDEYSDLEPFQPEFGWVRRKRLAQEKSRGAEVEDEGLTAAAENDVAEESEKKKPRRRSKWR